jgi:hypothetical protein
MDWADMTAGAALSAAKAAGVEIALYGDQLRLEAANPPSPELLELLRQHKAEIIANLRKTQVAQFEPAAFYEKWRTIAEVNGGCSVSEAQYRAFKSTVAEWLNRNFQPSPPGRCAHCHFAEAEGETLLAAGTKDFRHVWLHDACFPQWLAAERARGMSALQSVGVDPSSSSSSDASIRSAPPSPEA